MGVLFFFFFFFKFDNPNIVRKILDLESVIWDEVKSETENQISYIQQIYVESRKMLQMDLFAEQD